jgi:tRNA(Ile)-lysidine synthase
LLEVGFETIDEILESIQVATTFKINLPGNLFIEGDSDELIFSRYIAPLPSLRFETELQIPGITDLPELDLTFITSILLQLDTTQLDQGRWNAVLDLDRVKPPILIRNWKPGDRFTPLGMTGSKKLHDYFIDKKVSKKMRSRVVVVADQGKIVWIPGFVISENVRVTKATTRFLQISAISKRKLPGEL